MQGFDGCQWKMRARGQGDHGSRWSASLRRFRERQDANFTMRLRLTSRGSLLLAKGEGVGDGVVIAVAEGEAEFGDAEAGGGLDAFAVEDDIGFAGGFAADFDV